MKTLISTAAFAIALVSIPAHAQLIGSGGLGGTLGSSAGGTMNGTTGNNGTTVGSTVAGKGSVKTDKSVDTRSGRTSASSSASGNVAATLDGAASLPPATTPGAASASTSGTADAQVIGTDAVRGIVSGAVGQNQSTIKGAVGPVRSTLNGAGHSATNAAGSASANGQNAGSSMFSGSLGQLALAGTAAANGSGSFDVTPGMMIADQKGRVIGQVRSVETDARGTVTSVIAGVGNRIASIPASNFSGEGTVLVSAMSKGSLKSAVKDQAQSTNP